MKSISVEFQHALVIADVNKKKIWKVVMTDVEERCEDQEVI